MRLEASTAGETVLRDYAALLRAFLPQLSGLYGHGQEGATIWSAEPNPRVNLTANYQTAGARFALNLSGQSLGSGPRPSCRPCAGLAVTSSLDDFGFGLSSFAYLKLFPVDTLKIDGSFIRDLSTSVVSQSMVAAIAEVARVMRLDMVAEFVADDATLSLLASSPTARPAWPADQRRG